MSNFEALARRLDALTGIVEEHFQNQQDIQNAATQRRLEEIHKDWENGDPFGRRRAEQAPPDPAEVAQRMHSLSAEYERLSENPSANIARMDEIQKELDGLINTQQGIDRGKRAAYLQEKQPELDALNADIDTISATLEQMNQDPSQNWAKIEQLQGELDRRLERRDDINKGDDWLTVQWQG